MFPRLPTLPHAIMITAARAAAAARNSPPSNTPLKPDKRPRGDADEVEEHQATRQRAAPPPAPKLSAAAQARLERSLKNQPSIVDAVSRGRTKPNGADRSPDSATSP